MSNKTLQVKKINLQLVKNHQAFKRVLAFGYLGFHRATTDNTVWVVTHIQSGKAICKSHNKQAIKRFVKAFGKNSFWLDWKNNENEIRRALRLFGLKLSVKTSV